MADADPFPTSVPDDVHVARIRRDLGVSEDEARLVLALERGEAPESDAIDLGAPPDLGE